MNVVIDGISYVPAYEIPTDKGLLGALDLRSDSDVGDGVTIRYYLYQLLSTLWEEQEGFSGKRPFGNSGWERDLYIPLVKGGYLSGEIDSEGRLRECDKEAGKELVQKLIDLIFSAE